MDADLRLRRRLLMGLLAAFAATPALAAGGAEKDKKKGGGLSFIQLATLTATVAGPRGRRAVMTVEAGVDVKDEKLRELADLSQPRLRAAFTQTLQIYASGLGPGDLPDADYIARVLQRDTDRVLGKPGAKLLLGTILIN
ncbi:hypothetical protein [Phenylobacterium sp.]|nr:hypothetical protein [Phenylobacterium sp.]MBA4795554.1 hypothetical protein [Phenylobacterium sp.]MBC7167843.1 hypothetical protein [Phenylobacterium sp.]